MIKDTILLVGFLFISLSSFGQTNAAPQKSVVKRAHEKIFSLEDFVLTSKEKFKVKVFTVDTPQTNKTHHWFIQLLSLDNEYLNFASVVLNGYLKSDPQTSFSYMNPVMRMCTQGKYVIGFVKVKQPGIYVLNIAIDNFEEKDSIQVEINIPLDSSSNVVLIKK